MEEDEQQVCGRMGVFLPVCIFVCLCFSFVYMYIIVICEYIIVSGIYMCLYSMPVNVYAKNTEREC